MFPQPNAPLTMVPPTPAITGRGGGGYRPQQQQQQQHLHYNHQGQEGGGGRGHWNTQQRFPNFKNNGHQGGNGNGNGAGKQEQFRQLYNSSGQGNSHGHTSPRGGRGRGRGNMNHRGGRGRQRGGGGHGQFNFNNNGQFDVTPNKKPNIYCCSCERGFKTQEQLDEHNKEHIVCGLDGCLFEAHSLVVTKHIRMQHEGNLYERMKNLNTPEDIKRWREERKKNFPTIDKGQQKADEQKEKVGRREIFGGGGGSSATGAGAGTGRKPGGSAGPNNMGYFRYKIQQQESNRSTSFYEYQQRMRRLQYELNDDWSKRKFAPDPNLRHIRVPFFSLNKSKLVSLENFYLSVKMGSDGKLRKERKVKWKGFKARKLDRLEDSESDGEKDSLPISDEEDFYTEEGKANTLQVNGSASAPSAPLNVVTKTPSSLGLMLVDYSSASESEKEDESCEAVPKCDNSNPESSVKGVTDTVLQSCVVGSSEENDKSKTNGLTDDDDDEYNSDSSTESMIIDEFKEDAVFKSKPVYVKVGVRRRRKWMREKLLETLLQDEIRKERNTILQACRFITENNFFDE